MEEGETGESRKVQRGRRAGRQERDSSQTGLEPKEPADDPQARSFENRAASEPGSEQTAEAEQVPLPPQRQAHLATKAKRGAGEFPHAVRSGIGRDLYHLRLEGTGGTRKQLVPHGKRSVLVCLQAYRQQTRSGLADGGSGDICELENGGAGGKSKKDRGGLEGIGQGLRAG